MPLPATGAWRRAHEYTAPWQTREDIRADPGHERLSDDDEDPTWEAPTYQEAAPGSQWVGDDWVTATVPGIVLDRTPTVHDSRGDTHHTDYGAGRVRSRGEPVLQFDSERYTHERDDGIAAGEGPSVEALRRGFTIDAQNNPGSSSYGGAGWRPGWYHRWVTRRDFKPPPRGMVGLGRGVDMRRTVTPQTAYLVADAPAPAEPGPYNYTGDMPSLARAIRQWNMRPQMRRVPEPIDDALMVDERGPSPMPEDWVM